MYWQYKSKTTPTSIEELKRLLLAERQIKTAAEIETFFHPVHPDQYSLESVGLSSSAMKRAVERIHQAAHQKETVVIFGDYDVDGVCATAILWEALRAVGVVAQPFLPHREKHGYGLTARSLKALLAEHSPDLVITVDNGIVAHDAFVELKKRGIFTILTDHHSPEMIEAAPHYPEADIIVQSTQLSGSGVAWFLARELSPLATQPSLDLMSLATIADQMPLLGINRSFVVHGMAALKKTNRIGLHALMTTAGVNPVELTTETINYVLAPRINAMGRLKHSLDALRLVCTTSAERAAALVEELNSTNTTRQELTSDMIEHALQQAAQWTDQNIIIVADTRYHEGVIGLLASKLVETYGKPTIAIAIGETLIKASARSIPGVNITELIRMVKDDLLEVGGHPMAAGFAALPEKLASIQSRLEKLAKAQLTAEMLTPTLEVECALTVELVSLETAELVQELAPFGKANLEPIFALPVMKVVSSEAVGKAGSHLKLNLTFNTVNGPQFLTALGWSKGELAKTVAAGAHVRLAGTLCLNSWKNKQSLQTVIKDVVIIAE